MRRNQSRRREALQEPDWTRQVEQLEEQMRAFQLVMTGEIKQRITRFCSQLVVWNGRYALVSRQDVENALRKHVAASLGPLLFLSPNREESWVDVGSGAGFPGLILKIWYPEQRITLIDGSRKKCLFLEQISRELGLSPLPILQVRVETMVMRGESLGSFDVLFARAVADLGSTLREFAPLVRIGGLIVSFKGPGWRDDVKLAQELGMLRPDHYVLEEVVDVPWAQGHILKVRRTG